MSRACLILGCLALVACAAARQRRAEEHLRNELNFFVPYVDVDAEDSATRRSLAQRHLLVDDEARGEGFRALQASSLDHKRSAVRIITRRGVVAAEDADADDWFALRKVALWKGPALSALPETLLGIQKTARGQDAPCLSLWRLEADGRLSEVEMRIAQFGSYACVSSLEALEKGRFEAHVVWPALSAGVAPTLAIELRSVTPPLNAPVGAPLVLRVAEDGPWIERAEQALAQADEARSFAERQAHAVARAALSLAKRESVAQQLGNYRSALGGARPGSFEAEVMAETVAHIERAWSDAAAPAPAGSADGTQGAPPNAAAAEPALAPDDLVIEPDAGG